MAGGPSGSHYVIVAGGSGENGGDYRIVDPWDGTTYKRLGDYLETGTYRLKYLVRYEGDAPVCSAGAGTGAAAIKFSGIADGGTSQQPVRVSFEAPAGASRHPHQRGDLRQGGLPQHRGGAGRRDVSDAQLLRRRPAAGDERRVQAGQGQAQRPPDAVGQGHDHPGRRHPLLPRGRAGEGVHRRRREPRHHPGARRAAGVQGGRRLRGDGLLDRRGREPGDATPGDVQGRGQDADAAARAAAAQPAARQGRRRADAVGAGRGGRHDLEGRAGRGREAVADDRPAAGGAEGGRADRS